MNNKEALVPFGVSNELLQSLANATESFKEAAASPRNKIAKRSAGGKTIDAGIAAADKILKEQIKKLMPGLKKTFPDVYNAFITNSKIVDAPGISKATKAAKAANAKAAGDIVAANS